MTTTVPIALSEAYRGFAVDPAEQRLCTADRGGDNDVVQVADSSGRECIARIEIDDPTAIEFVDGDCLVIAERGIGTGQLHLYQIEGREMIDSIADLPSPIRAMNRIGQDRAVLLGLEDGSIGVIDVSARSLRRLAATGWARCTSLAVSADGALAIVGCEDGRAWVVDVSRLNDGGSVKEYCCELSRSAELEL